MKNEELKKYVRTTSGDFWEYVKTDETGLRLYVKPNVGSVVTSETSSIDATADTVVELVRTGDIVKFKDGHAESVDVDDSYILGPVVEIYTQYEPLSNYNLVAVKHNGTWMIK